MSVVKEWKNVLDIAGLIITAGGVATLNPYVIGFGAILIVIYIGSQIKGAYEKMEARLISLEKKQKLEEKFTNIDNRIAGVESNVAKHEGILMGLLRNKKGVFDPVSLIVILIIIILIILYWKGII